MQPFFLYIQILLKLGLYSWLHIITRKTTDETLSLLLIVFPIEFFVSCSVVLQLIMLAYVLILFQSLGTITVYGMCMLKTIGKLVSIETPEDLSNMF